MSDEDVLRFSVTDGVGSVLSYELPASFEAETLVSIIIGDLNANVDAKRVRLTRDGALLLGSSDDQLKKSLSELGINVAETDEEKARRLATQMAAATARPQSRPAQQQTPGKSADHAAAAARMAELLRQMTGAQGGSGAVQQPSTSSNSQTSALAAQLRGDPNARLKIEGRLIYAQFKANNAEVIYRFRREARDLFDQYVKHPDDEATFVKKYLEVVERRKREAALMMDENSIEGQKLIQEMIHRQLQDEAKMHAYEHTPEHIFSVTMLYIKMKINGEPVTAFIDTGAQVSIMSMECAHRCKLDHLVDKREDIVAHGVGGASRSLGKIHICEVQVGDGFFQCPFEVFSDRSMDLLVGLNVLKQHRAVINLGARTLEFGDGAASVPFLNDKEVEEYKTEMAERYGLAGLKAIPLEEVESAKVAEVVALGFDAAAAREALSKTGNNVEMAVQLLLHGKKEKMDH